MNNETVCPPKLCSFKRGRSWLKTSQLMWMGGIFLRLSSILIGVTAIYIAAAWMKHMVDKRFEEPTCTSPLRCLGVLFVVGKDRVNEWIPRIAY